MIAFLKHLFARGPHPATYLAPRTTPPTGQCRKCGQPFGGLMLGTPRPVPSIRYFAAGQTEGLLRTCPTCGYRWNEPVKS